MEEAEADGDPSALSAGEAVREPRVGQMSEPELGEEGGDDGGGAGGFGPEERGGEEEGLGDGEEREAVVVLGDVGGELAEGGGDERGGVEGEGAAEGRVRAERMSRRVDLPAPLGPTTARIWEGWAVKETSFRM
ncbi:hypothetical protein E2542_SST30357 [Spatholobus suberectus]|nr:hypothetical protein E2542_SST30357 [Spatholobus suberectus]